MSNIPRRRIYEVMLEFEDAMIDMQILLMNQENFETYKDKFNTVSYPALKTAFYEIQALCVLFLQNKKFTTDQEQTKAIQELMQNQEEIKQHLASKKSLSELAKVDKEIRRHFEEEKEIATLEQGKEFYKDLDTFNTLIPKVLEIRREEL